MKGLCRLALAALFLAACGRDGAITEPVVPTGVQPGPGTLALGTDPTTGAAVETSKDDYTPGEVVHLVGRGWAPGETVNLHMTEDPDTHADVDTNVVADATGGFTTHYYDVQEHDVGVEFTLTAKGETSGSVVVVKFTDGTIINATIQTREATLCTSAVASVAAGTPICAFASFDITGTGATSVQFRWKNPSGVITFINSRSAAFPNGTTSGTDSSVYTPTDVGTWTILLCQSVDVNPAPGGIAQCAASSQKASQTFTVTAAPPTNAAPSVDAGGPYTVEEGTGRKLSPTVSDADAGDVLSYKWTADITGIDNGGVCSFDDDTLKEPTITCTDDSNGGNFTLTLEVKDGAGGHTVTDVATLSVTNANPVAAAGGPYSGSEGAAIALSGSGNDPGNNDDGSLTYSWSVNSAGITNGGTCAVTNQTSPNLATVSCTDNGSATVSLQVSDDDGGSHTASVALTVSNADPVADAHGDYSGVEGANVSLTGSKTDAGSNDSHTYKWTYAAGAGADAGAACTFSDDTALSPTVNCTDDGNYTLTLKVTDDDGGFDTDDATLTLSNALPVVSITSPAAASLISLLNGVITVNASYTDAGANDTHQCRIELDGAIDVVNDYTAVSGGNCSKPILPVEAGVYTLTVRIKDDDGGVGSAIVMIVVYDPSAGFVTGGGWINSAAGAYVADASLAGKANFGFVSKYKRGATVPEGNTEFQFHAGGLNFHSSTYDFLIVNQAGTNAQFHGKGTINGAGNYTFMLWATDGGNSADKFRIKITDDNNGDAVVYDNGLLSQVEQLIAGGSIVIQTGGKK